MSKPKRERYLSPKGIAVWPRLNEPDTKFKPEGEYSVTLAYDGDDRAVRDLIAKLEKRRDELFEQWLSENPKKKKVATVAPVFTEELDDNGDETGRVLLKFKMRASGTSKKTGKKWTMRPDIFDARGRKLTNPPKIGGGSTLKVSFEVGGAFVESAKQFYLSLRLVAVQVIDLVEFGSRSAADYGFGEEDGFEADDEHFTPASTRSAADSAADSDDADDEDSDDGDDDGDY